MDNPIAILRCKIDDDNHNEVDFTHLKAVCALDVDMGVLLRPVQVYVQFKYCLNGESVQAPWGDRDAIDIGDRLLPAVEPDRLLLPNLGETFQDKQG